MEENHAKCQFRGSGIEIAGCNIMDWFIGQIIAIAVPEKRAQCLWDSAIVVIHLPNDDDPAVSCCKRFKIVARNDSFGIGEG